jgi:TusA-related sulfurtransferase
MNIKTDNTLNTCGLLCPLPILKAKEAIEKISSGQVLEILATDGGTPADFQSWTKRTGHVLLHWEEDKSKSPIVYKFYIQKKVN